jgi:hypothetical protein
MPLAGRNADAGVQREPAGAGHAPMLTLLIACFVADRHRLQREQLLPRPRPHRDPVGDRGPERNPKIKVIGVEPAQRHHKLAGLKRVTGLPDEHFPSILDRNVVDEYVSVTDEQAFEAGIGIARTDGILVGPTTGAVLHAAMEWSRTHVGTAVVISADNAAKYLSAYAAYL